MEVQAAAGEIARLEALLGADPGGLAFAALAEANRRAGRLEEAERVAREGLRRRPEHLAGRVALALALLDQERAAEARGELERVLADVPDHPLARAAYGASGDLDESLDELEDRELDGAFASAEPDLDEMVDANELAARALRAADLDEPEGFVPAADSPFATRTVAELLEQQGHGAEAAALRRTLSGEATGAAGDPERERVLATLERWLDNLRRLRR
jgi:tetratricopeptide (TPR) repeat protein